MKKPGSKASTRPRRATIAREIDPRFAAIVQGEYFDPGHGRLMKEWVAVADGSISWLELAREAHIFAKASKG